MREKWDDGNLSGRAPAEGSSLHVHRLVLTVVIGAPVLIGTMPFGVVGPSVKGSVFQNTGRKRRRRAFSVAVYQNGTIT